MTTLKLNAGPRIGIALGGGGARGLAHIPYIEAMDELGLRPSIISGTSIGALIGAGWANKMSGKELREHAMSSLGSLQLIAGRLWTTHVPTLQKLFQTGLSMQIDAENIVTAFLPEGFPDAFSNLETPFSAVATDIHTWQQVVFDHGPVRPAIAASIAIPALFKPVIFDDHVLVDGGVVNPLPLDRAAPDADVLVGIDVTGLPEERFAGITPNLFDLGIISTQIMSKSLIKGMKHRFPPQVFAEPPVNPFGILEFWRVGEIIAAGETQKDCFKRQLETAIAKFEAGQSG